MEIKTNNTLAIHWVNHASYIVSYGNLRLICDPWIEGRVFNQSWEHLAPSIFTYEDFADITHIWFSHEHPDHFFPPNLSKIPEAYRKRISVLFQNSMDGKVAAFCRKLGFKEIIELQPFKVYELPEGVSLINAKVSNDTDSWLYLKTGTCTLLNLNDCVFRTKTELEAVKQAVGHVDVLFTQFSYANWVGNRQDTELKKRASERKKQEIAKQVQCLQPRYTVPFASYVWFCHEDNFHMNAQANGIKNIAGYIEELGTRCIVLYPGQTWQYNTVHDNGYALEKYGVHEQSLADRPLTRFDSVSLEIMRESADKNRQRCLQKNSRNKLLGYKPVYVHLTDWGKVFAYSYKNGLLQTEKKADEADVSMHSQTFKYCLDFDWGYDSILVAGTFEKPANGHFQNFMEYEWVANLNNQGRYMPGLLGRLLHKMGIR